MRAIVTIIGIAMSFIVIQLFLLNKKPKLFRKIFAGVVVGF